VRFEIGFTASPSPGRWTRTFWHSRISLKQAITAANGKHADEVTEIGFVR
jgi:hypothetical protein